MREESIETQLAVIIDQLRRVNEDIKEIKISMGTLYVTKSDHDVTNQRVSDLEANNRWIVRTMIGSIIGGAVAVFFTLLKR